VPQPGVSILERPVPSSLAGRPLSELEAGGLGRLVAMGRNGTSALADPAIAAQEGDVVWVAVATDAVDDYDRTVTAPVVKEGGH
jgi:Trk K+ transport system NAD-binding subunit